MAAIQEKLTIELTIEEWDQVSSCIHWTTQTIFERFGNVEKVDVLDRIRYKIDELTLPLLKRKTALEGE